MRDIMCSGYVAGGNCRFFGLPAGRQTFEEPAEAQDVQRSLNERLSFADDSSGEYASMLAFLSPYGEEIASARDQVISISDRLLPWEVAKNADPSKKYFPGGQSGYEQYSRAWNLGQVHFGEDVRATESMAFMSQVRPVHSNPTRHTPPRTPYPEASHSSDFYRFLRAGCREQLPVHDRPPPQVSLSLSLTPNPNPNPNP